MVSDDDCIIERVRYHDMYVIETGKGELCVRTARSHVDDLMSVSTRYGPLLKLPVGRRVAGSGLSVRLSGCPRESWGIAWV